MGAARAALSAAQGLAVTAAENMSGVRERAQRACGKGLRG